jgi:hypothetical protein
MSLASYVAARCIPEPNSGCWLWLLSTGSHGYGQGTSPETGQSTTAHRLSYQAFKGPIPDGLFIDHLCRNKLCVNPDHLEAVSNSENSKRRAVAHGLRRHDNETLDQQQARLNGYKRAWELRNPERKAQWVEANRDHVRAYKAQWARNKYAKAKATA